MFKYPYLSLFQSFFSCSLVAEQLLNNIALGEVKSASFTFFIINVHNKVQTVHLQIVFCKHY